MTAAAQVLGASISVESATAEGKAAAVSWLMVYVALLPTAAAQDAFLARISERMGVGLEALRADLHARLPRGDPRSVPPDVGSLVRAALRATRLGCPATARACLEDALEEIDR